MMLTEHAAGDVVKAVDDTLWAIAVVVHRTQAHDDEQYKSGLKIRFYTQLNST